MPSLPTPGSAPAPTLTGDSSLAALHTGQIEPSRWRGPRQSLPLIGLMESVIADVASLYRRSRLARVLAPASAVQSYAPPAAAQTAAAVGVATWQLNAVRLQSLRQQIAFRLSSADL